MRRAILLFGLAIALVAVVVTGCRDRKTDIAATPTRTGLGAPNERVEFGHIESLTRRGDHFEMRFDPAWFLSGEAANRAAAEDGAVEPGQPAPNDNYVVEEGHRLLTYLVAASAQIRVDIDTVEAIDQQYRP